MYIAVCLKVISIIIYLNVLQFNYYKNIFLKIIRNMILPSLFSITEGEVEQISSEHTWVEHWPKMVDCNKPLKATCIHSADTTEQWSDQVVCFGSDDPSHVRVPEHKVSIRAHRYATLAGEQVEDLRCICAGHCHKLVFVHFTSYLLENMTIIQILASKQALRVTRSFQYC